MQTMEWLADEKALRLIDQTKLPNSEEYLEVATVDELVAAIQSLAVRGAPALGASGGYGVAIAMAQADREGWDADRLQNEIDKIRDARPTAVNLAWGVQRVRPLVAAGFDTVVAEADKIAAEDRAANQKMAQLGADWVQTHTEREKLRVVTHCNTGALATTAIGTAYGVIAELHRRGAIELVYADETRPLLQGARLTSFELTKDGIPHVIEADGAAASTILRGLADFAVIGADRIAANGDTANKIGSVSVALACARAGIPFVVVAPESTVDRNTPTGDDIHIEQRDGAEVLSLGGVRTAPAGAEGFNPAFDVTPHDLIAAIVTEDGVWEPNAN